MMFYASHSLSAGCTNTHLYLKHCCQNSLKLSKLLLKLLIMCEDVLSIITLLYSCMNQWTHNSKSLCTTLKFVGYILEKWLIIFLHCVLSVHLFIFVFMHIFKKIKITSIQNTSRSQAFFLPWLIWPTSSTPLIT